MSSNTTNKASPMTTAWRFDAASIRPGDILLEAGDTWFGRTIRAIERGTVSHALMWIGNTDFIEAVGGGVRVISVARVLVTDPDKWLWLRHPDGVVAEAAARHARNLAHKPYSLPKALATKVPGVTVDGAASLFCSQLVAESYARAGVSLVDGKPAGKVTPNDLARTPRLQAMGELPLAAIDLDPADTVFLDRDQAYAGSLPALERSIAQQAFAAVKPMASRLPQQPGNLAETLQALADDTADHSALADALLSELERRGYFSLLDGAMVDLAGGAAISASREEIAAWRSSARRHQTEFQTYAALAGRSPYPLWRRFARMYARNAELFMGLVERAEASASSL